MANFSVGGLVPIATIVSLGILLCRCLYCRYFHPLRAFPGPFLASWSNLWEIYQIANGQFEHELLRLHQKHGKIVRIGTNHLSFSDEGAVKEIYGAGRSFQKSTFYETFVALRQSLFTTRDENIHSIKRRRVANGFSAQALADMEQYIDKCIVKLIDRFDRAAEGGEQIDLKIWIDFCVLDILGELAFSRPFGILDSGDESLVPPVQKQVLLSMIAGQIPWVIPYVNRFAAKIPLGAIRSLITGRMALARTAVTSVRERIDFPSDRKDLLVKILDEFKSSQDSKGGGGIDLMEHHNAPLHVLTNPAVLTRLQTEIDQASPPDSGTTSYPQKATQDLPYLTAVVAAAFRINPVFVMPLPRVVPVGGRQIAGAFIPAGTEVSICNYALHHNEEVFGPDLETFQPERWLQPNYNRSGILIPFSTGHRACIGRNIAMAEIQKVVVSLLARYDIQLVNEQGHGLPRTKSYGIAEIDESMVVTLRRRPAR